MTRPCTAGSRRPYATKAETDANFVRCIDWLLHPDRMTGLRLGLASHNVFHVAWTRILAERRGVAHRVRFEMLQGMAEAQAAAVAESAAERRPLLYTPAVADDDFDVAIGYLFRRLEENASDDNFLRHLFDLAPGSAAFDEQSRRFARSVADRNRPAVGPRRTQDRAEPPAPAYRIGQPFRNEPETDPTLAANRAWLGTLVAVPVAPAVTPVTDDIDEIDRVYRTARRGAERWAGTDPTQRQQLLHRVGDELARRRGELMRTMAVEAGKTIAEADVEIAEAIDFARYYGDRAVELRHPRLRFTPFGVVAVIPPWNFPVAIPAGGMLAALAAGNAVVAKPAPETARCAEIVAEACWAAGVPRDALQFVRTPDDDTGRRLVTSADAVILTGSTETADLFRSWRPDLRLLAETSGKNAMIITPNADLDQAVADLVRSAFGHAGQKCSAASLAILVGDLHRSERFRRQLVDAVRSLEVGPADRFETTMGPLIGPPNPRLAEALALVGPWLVAPSPVDAERNLWRPSVLDDVEPDSWFHRTECFGPVLGLMAAADLDEAIELVNRSVFGLTGGIHSLDPGEVDRWLDRIEVGNAYVNRPITGAIVQRQPFGGWKRSSVGPGAKAGGPNYVAQLGTWHPSATSTATLGHADEHPSEDGGEDPTADPTEDYAQAWREHFAVEHDPTGLFCESNVFRYRPLDRILLRVGPETAPTDIDLVRRAAAVAGVAVIESRSEAESDDALAERLPALGVDRIRLVGCDAAEGLRRAAAEAGVHVADDPVVAVGRRELLHLVREQAVSRTTHRFGNLIGVASSSDLP